MPSAAGALLEQPDLEGAAMSLGPEMLHQVERATEAGDELVLRADLPGLRKEDVTVEITDDTLTIQGDRRDDDSGWASADWQLRRGRIVRPQGDARQRRECAARSNQSGLGPLP